VDADANPGDWPELVRQALRAESRVLVRVSAEGIARVSARFQAMLAEQIEVEHLLMPVVLTAVERDTRGWALMLRLQEALRDEP